MADRASTGKGSGETRLDRSTLVAFLLMVLFAGGNPVAVRFSNAGLPPFWGATLRFGAAALIFWFFVLARRIAVPRGQALMGAVVYGILSIGVSFAFFYWGLLRVSAGLAGSLLALVPLMTLFFAWAHGLEKLRWRGLIGAVVAIAGVVLGVAGGFGGAMHVPSVLALVAGVACMAEAGVVFKLFPQSHPMATNAVALTTGVLPLAVLSLVTGEPWVLPGALSTWAAYAYLVVIGSVAVFYLYLRVLSRWTASATSYAFLLMPVSTLVIAVLVAGEVVTPWFVAGAALVLAGVWVGGVHKAPPETAALTCAELPSRAIC